VGRVQPDSFTVRNVFRRLGRKDDPWAGIWQNARPLAPARRRLDAMLADGRHPKGKRRTDRG
jgi:DNA primase